MSAIDYRVVEQMADDILDELAVMVLAEMDTLEEQHVAAILVAQEILASTLMSAAVSEEEFTEITAISLKRVRELARSKWDLGEEGAEEGIVGV